LTHATLILVNGLPASGKSSLAKQLSEALAIPMLSKDGIKESLFDSLGWSDREWSMRLGVASMGLLWKIAREHVEIGATLILESNFVRRFADEAIAEMRAKTPVRVIEVHCTADREVLVSRYRARADTNDRHPGHVEWSGEQMELEFIPRLRTGSDEYIEQADHLIEVDTTNFDQVDIDAIVEQVRAAMA
jgi:predicted kinase